MLWNVAKVVLSAGAKDEMHYSETHDRSLLPLNRVRPLEKDSLTAHLDALRELSSVPSSVVVKEAAGFCDRHQEIQS